MKGIILTVLKNQENRVDNSKKKMIIYLQIPQRNHADYIRCHLMSNKKIKGNINQIMMVKDCKKIKNSKDLIKNLLRLTILYKEKSETNTSKIQYTNTSLQFLSKDLMESIILAQEEVLLFHRPLHRIIFMHKIHIHNRYFYLGLVFRNFLELIS